MNKPQVKVRVVHEYLLFKEVANPFIKLKSDSGIILAPGLNESRETGEMEQLDAIIGFGIVTEVGDKCTYVKPGDGIFYDHRSKRALPTGSEPQWQYQERNLIGYVDGTDGQMQEAFATYYKQLEELEAAQKAYNEQVAKDKEIKAQQTLLDISANPQKYEQGVLIKMNRDIN